MSLEDTKKQTPFQRQRNILYLISQYLSDFGFKQTKAALLKEACLSSDQKICDNIDLDTIYLDFCSYYHVRFGKLPKFVKKVDNEVGDPPVQKGKHVTSKSIENYTKATEDKAGPVTGSTDFVLTNSNSYSGNNPVDKSERLPRHHRRHMDTLEYFGEMRELAHIVESQIVRTDSRIKWSDVQGNEHAKQILFETVILPLKFPQLFTNLTKPWNGILMHGVSGVGKTYLAKALNSETFDAVTFFNISASMLISKWRGESEKFAKILFTMAKGSAPAIIFIDEFESLASRRDTGHDHEATKRFKNELLIQIDELDSNTGNVLLLANSNLPWEIDEAFLRRFERRILIDLPNEESRAKIIQQFVPSTKDWPESHWQQLVELSEGFTGSDLRIASKEASMIQIRNKLKSLNKGSPKLFEIKFEDLLMAIKQIKPSMAASAEKHRQWHSKFGNENKIADSCQ